MPATHTVPIRLFVGLGNPGPAYLRTRHNLGFLCLDYLIEQQASPAPQAHKRFQGHYLRTQEHHFLKPDTFMNLSGQSVQAVSAYYDIAPSEILVIHDELDLPIGETRLKYGGGTAGHNGLKSIQHHLNSAAFWRIRIGIGRPQNTAMSVSDYVLGKLSLEETQCYDKSFARIAHCCQILSRGEELSRAHEALRNGV